MANKVEKVLPFGNDDLDRNAYVISLLQKANEYGLVSDVEIRIFKQHLYLMLGCQSDRYMEGRSSSIPKDTAQQLLESIAEMPQMLLHLLTDIHRGRNAKHEVVVKAAVLFHHTVLILSDDRIGHVAHPVVV